MDAAARLSSAVWVAGELADRVDDQVVPAEVSGVWSALDLPPAVASERMADAGRRLGRVLFGADAAGVVAGLLMGLRPGAEVAIEVRAAGAALGLPVELMWLMTPDGAEVGPLGLLPGVSVSRMPAAPGSAPGLMPSAQPIRRPAALAGPVKILAAVAAPDETKTPNMPLDAEAEMQAVLDAVSSVRGRAEVSVLEVASLAEIRAALERDAYHVLHLSAHGWQDMVELEDEDGNPQLVSARDLVQMLGQAGRSLPLIVLSSCSSAEGAKALAAGLVRQGADRVIAMLAPVTESYATLLAAYLYFGLATYPDQSAGMALAQARHQTEQARRLNAGGRPVMQEFGLVTLLTAWGDGPLTDSAAAAEPLTAPVAVPTGGSVWALPLGLLIGRRQELRTVLGVLRRVPASVEKYGRACGVQLTGVGGIGKTAVAGRAVTRLTGDGWLIAVHEGRWDPAGLITAAAKALRSGPVAAAATVTSATALDEIARRLEDADTDDRVKLAAIAELLGGYRFAVVFDDFEQNLAPGGDGFTDPAFAGVFADLAAAVDKGGLLVTSRYPVPGAGPELVRVPVPPLSPSELRRMLLRMPALRSLDPAGTQLIIRLIGGHPRLIELTDALLRSSDVSLEQVRSKLAVLAARNEAQDLTVGQALDQALILGSADILLDELTATLTPAQASILAQVAISPEPVTRGDLRRSLTPARRIRRIFRLPAGDGARADLSHLDTDVERLADLTLLASGPGIGMHPWTAELVTRNLGPQDLTTRHAQALAMRYARVRYGRGDHGDLVAIPRHLAALGAYDDIVEVVTVAFQGVPRTLAKLACLAEVLPLIPVGHPAWIILADMEAETLLQAGDLAAASSRARAVHHQFQDRTTAEPADLRWQQGLAFSYSRLGDLALAAGDTATARAHYENALGIRSRLAAAAPSDADLQPDLANSYHKLGNLALATGDLATARTRYQAALDIAIQLAAADPKNTDRQHNVSVSHVKLGDLAITAGDLTTARAHHQAALDITARLAAADSKDIQRQWDLAYSHSRQGNEAKARGDLAAARTHHQAALDIRARLAAADPANTQWQRDLSVSHTSLGDVAREARDPATARAHYQPALDIAIRLAAADPANTEWQRDVSLSHIRMGDLAVEATDLAAARTHYQAAQDMTARMAAADPANTEWQRDLSFGYIRQGDLAAAAGDHAAARTAYQAALDIRARLAAADPANTDWQFGLAVSHMNLGQAAFAAGDLTTAQRHYQAALDISVQLASTDPANAQWQRNPLVCHSWLGDIAVRSGDLATARAHYQAQQDIGTRLAAADPADALQQRDLLVSHAKLGDLAMADRDLVTARASYETVLAIAAQIADGDPANAQWLRDLAASHSKLGDIETTEGNLTAARAAYQAGAEIAIRLAKSDPANSRWQELATYIQEQLASASSS